MIVNICPFCGVATGVAHETQAQCIEALHLEIARTREMLRVREGQRWSPAPLASTVQAGADTRHAAEEKKKATQPV